MILLTIFIFLLGFACMILAMAKGWVKPGCAGDCYQGRKPCNCRGRNE